MFDESTSFAQGFVATIHTDNGDEANLSGGGTVLIFEFAWGYFIFKIRGFSICNLWLLWKKGLEMRIFQQYFPMFFEDLFHFFVLCMESGGKSNGLIKGLFFFFRQFVS